MKYFAEEIVPNPSALSKVLNEFEKDILDPIEGKNDIKKQSPKSIPRKSKAGQARRPAITRYTD